ncbi:MAG: ABC transporter substrate-binding protein [Cyanobacteria bacterium P01_A01_bin.123]
MGKKINHKPNQRWFSIWRWAAITVLISAIAACSNAPDPNLTASDAESTEPIEAEVADAPPTATADRIVTLTPLTADLVQTLDEDKLVGVPGSPLIRQDSRFATLEIVSEGRTEPDLEKIIALEPDLVIGALGFHDKSLARLQEHGVDTLAVDVTSWEALEALTEDLAQRTNTNPDSLLARYDACLAQAPETSPDALVLVSRQPLLSPNKASWAGDFLAQFNIQNVTAELQGESPFDGYITLSEEKVLTADPDMLLVVETDNTLREQLKGDPFWGELAATQTNQVYTFDYFGLVNPGSLASIEATCSKLAELSPS